VPAKGDLAKPEDLIGKNVVTSFTNLAEQYFRKLEAEQAGNTNGEANGDAKLKTVIKYVGGSVEAACALGVADGIVDLVESGETMRAAGLKAISTVVSSSAILIKSKHPSDPKLVELITARIKGVISKWLDFSRGTAWLISPQLHKSTSCAHTTSTDRNSTSRVRSLPDAARLLSTRWKKMAGWPFRLWF
jgi:ATP phosphoribosyltransferase